MRLVIALIFTAEAAAFAAWDAWPIAAIWAILAVLNVWMFTRGHKSFFTVDGDI